MAVVFFKDRVQNRKGASQPPWGQ